MAGGGRYDNLVGMFDSKGREVHFQHTVHLRGLFLIILHCN